MWCHHSSKAGKITFNAGLVHDKGWCPVNQQTFESTKHKDVYVISDSSVTSALPKSGYSANSESKGLFKNKLLILRRNIVHIQDVARGA